MTELTDILLIHAKRYPLMQPVDANKLLYQAEFGGAHILKHPEMALPRILAELETVEPAEKLTVEAIGNGLVRVHLPGLKAAEARTLSELFLQSAGKVHGSEKCFEASLERLTDLCEKGLMPFSAEALSAELSAYRAEGLHPVSHSEIYREAYHPAYRVLCASDAAKLRSAE